MIGFEIDGIFLDMPENAAIEIEVNTPIYTGGDPTQIKGSFTFPLRVPLTKTNKIVLDFPHRPDNHSRFKTIEGVTLYLEGLPIFRGTLWVMRAGNDSAQVSLVINAFAKITEKKLNEVITDSFSVSHPLQMVNIIKATTALPEQFDFVFCPIFNREWKNPEDRESGNGEFDYMLHRCQNFWNVEEGNFVYDPKNIGITPFLKYEYLIRTILEASGHTLIDEFFDDELKGLYMYNNFSISNPDGSPGTTIDFKNHVPDLLANEAIKQFCSLFFTGVFANPFDSTILLKPLRDVLSEPEKDDWTSKADPANDIVNNEAATPNQYRFELDPSDMLSERYTNREFEITGEVNFDSDVPLSNPDFPEYYYAKYQNQIIKRHNNGGFLAQSIFKYFIPHLSDAGLNTYDIKLSPLFMTRGSRAGLTYTYSTFAPEIGIRGMHGFTTEDQDAQSARAGHRIFFYRGIQPTKNGKTFPMASNQNYNYAGTRIGEYSLLLNGDDGIISKWGAEVVRFMEQRRTIEKRFHLTIKDLLNFKPQNKIRVENINYFVSKMRISATVANGIRPVRCTLESTL